MKYSLIVPALALAFAVTTAPVLVAASAPLATVKGPQDKDKPLVTVPAGAPAKTFITGSFTEVSAGSALHVLVRKGNKHNVSAWGPKNLIDELEIKEGHDGKLAVGFKQNNNRHHDSKEPVVLLIESPSVNEVSLSGAALGVVQGFSGGNFELSLSGASQCQLDITCDKLSIEAGGASQLTATGKAKTLDAELSGASTLSTSRLASTNVKIEASGASKGHVQATGNLTVEASGASLVTYTGNPKTVTQDATGMSKISKE